MLHRIEITNFRSCQHVILESIGGVLALVGRNGAGKTNILRAIEWAAQTAASTQPVAVGGVLDVFTFLSAKLPKVTLDFSVPSIGNFQYSIEILQRAPTDSKEPLSVSINETLIDLNDNAKTTLVSRTGEKLDLHDRRQVLSLGASTPFLKVLLAILPEHDKLHQLLREVTNYLERIRYYSLEIVVSDKERLVHANDYNQWSKESQQNSATTSVVMRLLHLYLTRRDDFDEISSLVGTNGLDLISKIDVQSVSIKPEPDDVPQLAEPDTPPPQPDFYFVTFVPTGFEKTKGIRRFGFENLSFGTQRLLTIVTSIIFDKSSVLLIEQPEDGIHVGLLHKLQPLFKSYTDSMQFLLASHSRDILDRFAPKDVRLVSLADTSTSVRALEENEIAIAEQFMDEEGPLSDFIESLQDI